MVKVLCVLVLVVLFVSGVGSVLDPVEDIAFLFPPHDMSVGGGVYLKEKLW